MPWYTATLLHGISRRPHRSLLPSLRARSAGLRTSAGFHRSAATPRLACADLSRVALPDAEKAHAPSTRRGTARKRSRGLRVVGARGFEPPTFRSRIWRGRIARRRDRYQRCGFVTYRHDPTVQRFAVIRRLFEKFCYPFAT